ncbi:hypothetical protein FHD46_14685 [Escherichia coli]|nr:hypothetical protein C1192_17745 [Escherichia marmotae]EEV6994480.1 hypothetical protein [Escherichia coli]PSS40093.1 hypothetical protein BEM40_013045 [Escherichia sp. MOD1-EC5451]EFA4952818.1 hypothetical protein [Escherichia coli]EFB2836549.1 hypothetical protein [Escherichia coli]
MIKTTPIETLFYFYRIIVFILKLITKKPPLSAMVCFLCWQMALTPHCSRQYAIIFSRRNVPLLRPSSPRSRTL